MLPRSLLILALLVPGPGARAGGRGTAAFYDSSLLAWVDAVASELDDRLGGQRALALDLSTGPGLDERRSRRVLRRTLRDRLAPRGIALVEPSPAVPTLSLGITLEGGAAWAVGRLEGPGLPGAAVAVSWPMDRELEALLARPRAHLGQGAWALERLGTLPSGVLDLILVNLDGDDGDEIATLSVDGLRTWRFEDGAARPQPLGGPWALGPVPHQRFPSGWLARIPGGLAAATTAWGPAAIDPISGRILPAPAAVLLRQPPDPAHPAALSADRVGGAELRLRALDDPLGRLLDRAPDRLRDLRLWPGAEGAIWITAGGRLGGIRPGGAAFTSTLGAVGDRTVLRDLDGDGRLNLAITDPSGPGEPDRLRVLRVDEDGTPLLFEAGFEGEIVALAAGDLDFDGRPDLILAEEAGDLAILWRLERRR